MCLKQNSEDNAQSSNVENAIHLLSNPWKSSMSAAPFECKISQHLESDFCEYIDSLILDVVE